MIWKLIAKLLARPAVTDWLIRCAMRTPYTHITKDGQVYMERYWLFNPYPLDETGRHNKWRFPISIRLHFIRLPDQDRDLHDHPWNCRTIILKGGYVERRLVPACWLEEGYEVRYRRLPGETASLRFGEYHRIEQLHAQGTWTMFITGPYKGTWGFLVNGVKVPWREYLGLNK